MINIRIIKPQENNLFVINIRIIKSQEKLRFNLKVSKVKLLVMNFFKLILLLNLLFHERLSESF